MSQMILRFVLLFQKQYMFHVDFKKLVDPTTQWYLGKIWFKVEYDFLAGWFLELWK